MSGEQHSWHVEWGLKQVFVRLIIIPLIMFIVGFICGYALSGRLWWFLTGIFTGNWTEAS